MTGQAETSPPPLSRAARTPGDDVWLRLVRPLGRAHGALLRHARLPDYPDLLVISGSRSTPPSWRFSWDPYPFILLNLAFSTQAAYAAPLILLAQTRQTERDKAWSEADSRHREELSQNTLTLLAQNTELLQRNTELTEQVEDLSRQMST